MISFNWNIYFPPYWLVHFSVIKSRSRRHARTHARIKKASARLGFVFFDTQSLLFLPIRLSHSHHFFVFVRFRDDGRRKDDDGTPNNEVEKVKTSLLSNRFRSYSCSDFTPVQSLSCSLSVVYLQPLVVYVFLASILRLETCWIARLHRRRPRTRRKMLSSLWKSSH